MVKIRAPELSGATHWINGKISLRNFVGKKVILLDFFEFTCINCIRTIPYLRIWWERYRDKGLIVVGIHTPEFERSKDLRFLMEGIKRFGIEWPVAVDNEYKIWNAYANMYWPRKHIIDSEGYIVYDHIGEGKYRETEIEIQNQLLKVNPYLKLPEPVKPLRPEDDLTRFCYPRTPETYAGFLRGRFLSKYYPDRVHKYIHTYPEHDGVIALSGVFKVEEERTVFIKGKMMIRFKGNSVNAVMYKEGGGEVEVRMDGKPLRDDVMGEDVYTSNGRTYVAVNTYRMYNLVSTEKWGVYTLELIGENLEVYSFTFGSKCVE